MSNKAVIGAAALGISVYKANEYFKDRQVEKEMEERLQLEQDRHQAYYRRMAESEQKRGKQKQRGGMGSNAGASHRIFQAALFSQIDELLFELILKVGDDEDESNRIFDKQHVNLPLMSNECEKEDLMLAAAFAFGDEDLIQMVALRFTEHKLGIGLKKCSSNSILRIINILESMDEPLVDMRSLTMFVSFGLDDTSGFRSGRPVVKLLPNDFVYWEQLHEEAEAFGFHVIPFDQMRVKVANRNRKPKMKYFFKESGRRSHYGSTVLLSNFRSNFEASAKAVVTLQRSGVASDLDKISIIGGKMNRRIPNLEKMTDIYAKKLAAKRARGAAGRLRFLLAQCDDQDEGLVPH